MEMGTSSSRAVAATADSSPCGWSRLSWDITELILSHLPLRSIVAAGVVCRQWRAVVTHPSFADRAVASPSPRRPWFFLFGHNNVVPRHNQAFAFDPDSVLWSLLPVVDPQTPHLDSLSGSSGFVFATTPSSRFLYSSLPRAHPWRHTPPLSSPRCNPLVAVDDFPAAGTAPRFIVVGGARFIGGLVDIEDRLAAEIYDPVAGDWEQCPPLPHEFRQGNSSQWLSSALLGGRRMFFVHGIYSGLVAALDLDRRIWSNVRLLRPPGILFAFLIACGGDRLVLAGLCDATADESGGPSFVLWLVDHTTMGIREIGAMPGALLSCLFDGGEDDDNRFASLKCVGLDGLVYVFNEDHHKAYPACVCEVVPASAAGFRAVEEVTCTWSKVPPLPGPVNKFHKVVAFCSAVPIHSALAAPIAATGNGHQL